MICPKHGKFTIKANTHLNGHGCRLCSNEKNGEYCRSTLSDVITKGNIIHNNKYDYSLSIYVNSYIPMKIICPIHGIFEQMPYKHLDGQGCPKCNQSHMETMFERALIDNDIKYQSQKKFSWLGLQSLDFYLPKYNIGIECQGIQHFEPTKHFKNCEVLLKRDELKHQLCSENNLKLLYYTDYNISDEVLNKHRIYTKNNLMYSKEELLNKIIN